MARFSMARVGSLSGHWSMVSGHRSVVAATNRSAGPRYGVPRAGQGRRSQIAVCASTRDVTARGFHCGH